jgi:ferredoxin-thioredoxin reductase catalytic subunit
MKNFWRCHICNDIHYGIKPPETCPTCRAENAYLIVSDQETKIILEPARTPLDEKGFREAIETLAAGSEFRVNPDESKVASLIEGVFVNEANHGLKYCPCRLIEKDFENDLKIVCPCHFQIHETYRDSENGECWCGLFVKKELNK